MICTPELKHTDAFMIALVSLEALQNMLRIKLLSIFRITSVHIVILWPRACSRMRGFVGLHNWLCFDHFYMKMTNIYLSDNGNAFLSAHCNINPTRAYQCNKT